MDKVTIFNLALSAMGTKNRLASPDQAGVEASECRLWYDTVRRQVLCSAFFQEARANVRLALQAERDTSADWMSGDPDPGWLFSYATPVDMLRPRYLSTYERFILSASSLNEKRLVTNTDGAILVYTKDQESMDMWSPTLTSAIVYGLAAAISLKLGGKMDRMQLMAGQANTFITQARVYSDNVDEFQVDSIPPWLSARGVDTSLGTRYFFPYGPVFLSDAVSVA